jgi:hypothetical protein
MSIEALKLALEALKSCSATPHWPALQTTIKSIEEALAKQEQCKYPNCDYPCMNLPDCREHGEPVAWNRGVPPVHPQQKEGETFIFSYEDPQPKQEQGEPIGTAGELFTNAALERLDFRPSTKIYTTPQQRTEQNFCSRCGKRTKDLTHIHTCTPPKENT